MQKLLEVSIGLLDAFIEELLNIPERDNRVSVDKDGCFEYFIVLSQLNVYKIKIIDSQNVYVQIYYRK